MRRPALRPLPAGLGPIAAGLALLVTGPAALAQVTVLAASFVRVPGPQGNWGIGLENYQAVWPRIPGLLGNTILYASLAGVVTLAGGLLAGYILVRRPGRQARLLHSLLTLAAVLPGTVLGLGLIVTWGRHPLALTGSGAILVIAFIVQRIPHIVRSAAAGVRQIPPILEEASLTLGAGPVRTCLRVTLPLLLPAALSAVLVSWTSTIGELSSTIMLYASRTETVSVQIYQQALAGSFGAAAALGSVLTVLTLGTLWLLCRRPDGDWGGLGP